MNAYQRMRRFAARIRGGLPVPVAYGVWRDVSEQTAALETLIKASRASSLSSTTKDVSYAGVIFSKDRALQMHALVRSYCRHVAAPRPPLTLLYRASTTEHAQAYAEAVRDLQASGDGLTLHAVAEPPGEFRAAFLHILEGLKSTRVFCLVDDIVFIRPFAFQNFDACNLHQCVPSLRLGRGITHSYTSNQDHAVPALAPAGVNGLLKWRWAAGERTWNYPMSVDGNIFDHSEFLAMARLLRYRGPNSLESGLARAFGLLFSLRGGVCFEQARLINAPWNCVQSEIDNRCGELTENDLLRRWQDGDCLDVAAYDDWVANATHVEIEPKFIRRM